MNIILSLFLLVNIPFSYINLGDFPLIVILFKFLFPLNAPSAIVFTLSGITIFSNAEFEKAPLWMFLSLHLD